MSENVFSPLGQVKVSTFIKPIGEIDSTDGFIELSETGDGWNSNKGYYFANLTNQSTTKFNNVSLRFTPLTGAEGTLYVLSLSNVPHGSDPTNGGRELSPVMYLAETAVEYPRPTAPGVTVGYDNGKITVSGLEPNKEYELALGYTDAYNWDMLIIADAPESLEALELPEPPAPVPEEPEASEGQGPSGPGDSESEAPGPGSSESEGQNPEGGSGQSDGGEQSGGTGAEESPDEGEAEPLPEEPLIPPVTDVVDWWEVIEHNADGFVTQRVKYDEHPNTRESDSPVSGTVGRWFSANAVNTRYSFARRDGEFERSLSIQNTGTTPIVVAVYEKPLG